MDKEVQNNINVSITHMTSFIAPKVYKDDILEQITEAAQKAVDNESIELRIYYSGHGHKGTGNWVTAKPVI